ncbi:1,4-alpha-glucan branching enzyme [Streptoalloteichus tenebrarius]|uniref:1,4-alpha-glucan branching enzyme n=1 Tax=Streptoalloteichus tenebrarius (strain ATCC 17920 / DSM 40477 / JCM 4838 / CBS 697.72 / NBRC 16177 / NCIMB 11028 / NRRL B-12390 / A12253. 1 / ISP 5477) TaxID=1933 RepID=A0ABT1HWP1_STRSD|nr:glycoside hydrolase family 57 protein [Streptoalloteichus tenebrarius]MCP2259911.1 1,4-alpha-glucan branching enzyme [Streptoalloteichus tenebrarius]BFF03235.1 glycoside hydrolase family 57 protein [Streptoalloteichus tenebrarius]
MSREPVGSFCLVLHSHLPWLAHHGSWPVGEEWLYQAWAHSYLPVIDLVERMAERGHRDVLTLGVTPVLAAQLDDPYCLRNFHHWLGTWRTRAHLAATRWGGRWKADPALRELAAEEHRQATRALDAFESRWRHGFSPLLRPLVDAGVIELLGGPATHPFQPLLDQRVRSFALRAGLTDTAWRVGTRPEGIWAPECGYAPGMEADYAAAGVRRFLVDGPSLRGETAFARTVGDSDVICFGRDLDVTYRVWSPRAGYPGHAAYRDFHTFDHPSGLKPCRVTGKHVPPERKKPYEPALAAVAVREHVRDFVDVVVRRLRSLADRHGRPGMVVAAYDTELYGHWWHEGPQWLEAVLTALPEAGVRVTTLRGAVEAGHLGDPVDLPASSWGSGKDWRVWDGEQVADLVATGAGVQRDLLSTVDELGGPDRDPVLDQVVREALLALSSDWAFMVTKDSAASYARERADRHTARFRELATLAGTGRRAEALALARRLRREDGPFGHLDARDLARRA